MKKFEFLLGHWNLEYRIPKSVFSEAGTDRGTGTIKRALKDKVVYFDYATRTGGEAHGIFAWDEKARVYRYWWFENTGNFMSASCEFIDDKTLFLNWHDTLIVQTFTKEGPDKVVLKMEHPTAHGMDELILEVLFTRN